MAKKQQRIHPSVNLVLFFFFLPINCDAQTEDTFDCDIVKCCHDNILFTTKRLADDDYHWFWLSSCQHNTLNLECTCEKNAVL